MGQDGAFPPRCGAVDLMRPLCGWVGKPRVNPPYRMWRTLPSVNTEGNDASNISEDMLMYDKKRTEEEEKKRLILESKMIPLRL